jgi:hypothetical protein
MEIEEAKKVVMDATENGAWIERCHNKHFLRLSGVEETERIYFEALDELHKLGLVVQVPSAGQSRSSVSFRRADQHNDVKQLA